MFEANGPVGPLACAAMKGKADELQLLLNSAICNSDRGMVGDRLIDYSIFGSNPGTHDFLVPFMPSDWVSKTDARGRGPLHLALEYTGAHTQEIVKRLLEAGADVFARDVDDNDAGELARVCDDNARIVRDAESDDSGDLALICENDKAKTLGIIFDNNVRAYFNALLSSGFGVELGEDGCLWWSTND